MAELAPVGLIVRKAVAAGWRRSPCAGLHAWLGEGACASEMTSSRRATVTASSRGRDSLQSNSHGELPRERRPRGKGEHYNVQRYNTHGNVEEYSVLQLRATDRSTPIRRRLSEEGGGLIRAPSTPAERSARACSTPRMRARRGVRPRATRDGSRRADHLDRLLVPESTHSIVRQQRRRRPSRAAMYEWRSLHCNSNSSSRTAARRRTRSCNNNDGGVHHEQQCK